MLFFPFSLLLPFPSVPPPSSLPFSSTLLLAPLLSPPPSPPAFSSSLPLSASPFSLLYCFPRDNPRNSQRERRTQLVVWELAGYRVDIAALSEARCSEEGQLEKVVVGYTFFWNERLRAGRLYAVVVFATRRDIAGRHPRLPQGINGQLMSLRLRFRESNFIVIISACILPVTGSEETKTKFYEGLHAFLASVAKADMLIVLDNFNASVGAHFAVWSEILGPHRIAGCGDDGLSLSPANLR
nr:unnamed protein product [Spirometra erinaceieuropaei]